MARTPLRLLPRGLVVPVLQGPLRGARWIVGSGTHGCWLGWYEAEKQRMFASHVLPGSVVYDVGANVGFYTLLASKLAGSEGAVYSFEPLPRNVEHLQRHVELNDCRNVEIWPVAVGNEEGRRRFDPADGASTGRLSDGGSLEVETVAIDSLVESGRIKPPNMLKIDIEGGETDMLRGAERTLRRLGPTIFLAAHGSQNRTDCLTILSALGYTLSAIGSRDLANADEFLAQRGLD
jgi:FkbM family methyltransferase